MDLNKLKTGLKYAIAIILAAVGFDYAMTAIRRKRTLAIADKLEAQQRALGVQIGITRAQLEQAAEEFANQKGAEDEASIKSFYLQLIANKQ